MKRPSRDVPSADSEMNGFHSNSSNGTSGPKDIKKHPSVSSYMAHFFHYICAPLFLMIFAPNLNIILWYVATKHDGSMLSFGQELLRKGVFRVFVQMWSSVDIVNPTAIYIILSYIAFAIFLQLVLPGPRVEGPVTPKGNIPVYKDNGFFCFIVTMLAFAGLTITLKQYQMTPTIVYDNLGDILGCLTVFSHVLCIFLNIKGRTFPSTSDCRSSGNLIYDYYVGTELYPRILGIDVKVFTNCRFGMTVWPLLVCIFTLKNYELHGFVDSIWVSAALQMIYFTKFFWWEAGYMRTIDIMLDSAGFAICWGCLAFIPGLYASVSMYLVNHPVHLGPTLSLIIFVFGTVSIILNYIADKQKQDVRATNGKCLIWGRKPEVIRAKYQTQGGQIRESLLLVSGYWGIARHFHYVSEIVLAFFWSVPGLFQNLMVYSYFMFLIPLLIHRTFRDDDKCSKKYGSYWEEYCRRVPYKMIPGIF